MTRASLAIMRRHDLKRKAWQRMVKAILQEARALGLRVWNDHWWWLKNESWDSAFKQVDAQLCIARQLKRVELHSCGQLTDGSLEAIGGLACLRHLTLKGAFQISHCIFAHLRPLPHLR